MRGCLVLENDQLKEYIKLVFDAYWKNNEDVNDNKVLSKILNQIDIKLEEFIDKIEKNDVKEKLKKFTSDAFKKKIFGAPTFVINNKNFWGQDRFEYAIEEFNSIS